MTPPDAHILPPGTRLVHIGPHKTGTTAIQSAFHTHRRDLAAQDVHYAGPNRQPMMAVHALVGRSSPYADGKTPPKARWQELVREVARANGRVVISSEGFADADDHAIRTAAADLTGGPLQVVVTLRPLTGILPSQWQQYVQSGLSIGFGDWLEAMLLKTASSITPSFWHRHRHDELIARWAAAAGPSNVTVVVADDRDHGRVLRVFESLLGLREGTLVPEPALANRSLSWPEVETVRALNAAFRKEGFGTQLHTKLIRMGAAEFVKRRRSGRDEPGIVLPLWARDRANAIGAEMAAAIAASGVRVVGEIDRLAGDPGADSRRTGDAHVATAQSIAEETWAEVAATTALGVVLASGLARGRSAAANGDAWPDGSPVPDKPRRPQVEPLELARVSTALLGFVLLRRLLAAAASRLGFGRRSG